MKKITLTDGITPIKPVKRTYKKKSTGASAKAPKTSSTSEKAPRKASKAKGISKTSKPKKAKKAIKRRSPEEMAELRQRKFEEHLEREAQKAIREYEKQQRETERYAQEVFREAERAERQTRAIIREMEKAEREQRRAEREAKRQLRQEKARQITENKVKAEWELQQTGETWSPKVFQEQLIQQVTAKFGEYSYADDDNLNKLSDILGYNIKDLLTPGESEKHRTKAIRDYMETGLNNGLYTEDDLIGIYRSLESYDRKNRYHIKGLDEDFDPKTAKDIYDDIMGSGKVSEPTKEIMKILGPKGVILYLNYRNIMKLQFGELYRQLLYNPAASVFWELPSSITDNLDSMSYKEQRSAIKGYHDSVKGFGYKPSTAKAQRDNKYLAGMADAVQFTKYASTFMGYDEHLYFLSEVENKSSLDVDWKNVI